MYKGRGARAELLFRQSKPIAFLTFSITSPLSLLKLPIPDHAWKTTLKTRLGQVKYCMLHQNPRPQTKFEATQHIDPILRVILREDVCYFRVQEKTMSARCLIASHGTFLGFEHAFLLVGEDCVTSRKKSILYLSSLCNVIHS